jgi:histidine triad (HIT) family protein
MASIFTKIINREIPAHIVAEDEHSIAFLDIMPLVKGHVLVVPKQEIDYIFDMEPDALAELNRFAQKVAKHVHIHLIPMKTMDDVNFSRPKLKLSQEEFAEIAEKIRGGF